MLEAYKWYWYKKTLGFPQIYDLSAQTKLRSSDEMPFLLNDLILIHSWYNLCAKCFRLHRGRAMQLNKRNIDEKSIRVIQWFRSCKLRSCVGDNTYMSKLSTVHIVSCRRKAGCSVINRLGAKWCSFKIESLVARESYYNIVKWIFLNENVSISIDISL